MLPPLHIEQAINQLVREEWGRILASLVKSLGSLQLAEDALQDAVEAALHTWKEQGLPNSPAAWLIQAARRRAIDRLRRQQKFAQLQPEIAYLMELENQADNDSENDSDVIPDKRLELIFTCCHPSLDRKTRVALTLRALGGLSTEEIAHTFLDKTATMAQRLARARNKIAVAGIAYEVPDADRMPERLDSVLEVVYFIFNEGYAASFGKTLTRTSLSDEAIRLGRILKGLMPDHTEVAGLLSLMLLHDSRRSAREDESGCMVALEHQVRKRWDKVKIREGTALLKTTLPRGQVGPYQVQAAISALHSEADTWQETDWPQIVALYELLYAMQPTPVVRVNQAIAVSYAQNPAAALAMLDSVACEKRMLTYQPYRVARAELLFRDGKPDEAIEQMRLAISLTDNERAIEFLEKRLSEMTG